MCKYMNGRECECEYTQSNICKPNDCEYMKEDNMYETRLNELKRKVTKTKDNHLKKLVENIIESAEWYFNCDELEDVNNFDGFLEGCRPSLDYLIGKDNVEKACKCADLYIEHFGLYFKNKNSIELQSIYTGIVECILTMVLDCNLYN